jgi:hypothetical protein
LKTKADSGMSKRTKKNIKEKISKESKKKMSQLTDLPHNILVKIINYLPTENIVRDVSLVSKQLNKASKDPSVRISVEPFITSRSIALLDLSPVRFDQIRNLTISIYYPEDIEILTSHLHVLSSLTNLHIMSGCKLSKKLLENVFQCKCLKDLQIFGSIEDSSLETIGECVRLERIELLTTGCAYKLSETEFKALASLKNLSDLHFNDFQLNLNPKEAINEFLVNRCRIFVTLHIDMEDIEMAQSQKQFIKLHFPKVDLILNGGTVDVESQEKLTALRSFLLNIGKIQSLIINCKTIPNVFLNQLTGWRHSYDSRDGMLSLNKTA